jgi:putative membrane protein
VYDRVLGVPALGCARKSLEWIVQKNLCYLSCVRPSRADDRHVARHVDLILRTKQEAHMIKSRLHASALLASAMVVAALGCKKADRNTADTTAGMAAPVSSNAAPASSTSVTPANAPLNDANIAAILDQANASDSARGALAEKKGTSTDVKNFGKLMIADHHALRRAGQNLVKKLNVTPQLPVGDSSEAQAKSEMDSLTAMAKGAAWDKAYINYEVGYHQALLETATKALGVAQNQELKNLIKGAAPTVQHHLDRAKAIQKKQGA